MGGGAGSKPMSFSSTNATPTQRAPQPLRPHTDKSVKVCTSILSTFTQRDPRSPDCVVDDDDNDVNGEEDENDVTMYAQ